MFQPRTLIWILLLLIALGLVQMALFYPRMPDTMAVHFDASGQADGWSARSSFFGTMAVLHVGISLLMLAVAYLMKVVPMRFMNLPRKEYWSDPDHEDEARDSLYAYMLWFACSTAALLNAIMYMTFRINQYPGQGLGLWPWVVLAAYLLWTAAWVVRMIWRFYRIPKEEGEMEAKG